MVDGDVISSYDAKDTLYQSVTMVGTLLLQMGEVGQRLKNRCVTCLFESSWGTLGKYSIDQTFGFLEI